MEPREHHEAGQRRQSLRAEHAAVRAQRISLARGLVFLLGCVVVWAVFGPPDWPWPWLVVPTGVFLALVVAHGREDARRADALHRAEIHRAALDRMDGRWPGVGPDGAGFVDPSHPYSHDLDILGPGSLFQHLCAAQSFGGLRTLARWLTEAADVGALRARQGAVAALRDDVDAREELALAGRERRRVDLDPADVAQWADAPPWGTAWLWRVVAALVSATMIATLLGWLASDWPAWWFVVAVAAGYLTHARVAAARGELLRTVQVPAVEMGVLSRLLVLFERAWPDDPHLRSLHDELLSHGAPSRRIRALGRWLEILDWERNMMFGPVAALLLWRAQITVSVERWRRAHGPVAARWLDILGEWEALQSLARHAFEHPADPFPEFTEELFYEAVGLAHPLLPETVAVRNDVRLDASTRLLLVSGSNMSGKSTLLRSVGTNAVLAQAGGVVRATALTLAPFSIGASIRAQDSLLAGSSRFHAELQRLRLVLSLSERERPLLFLLDEIFHGTHSHDRRLGAQAFLARLIRRGAIGLVTTHDLALTRLDDRLGAVARNVHFQDDLRDGAMTFDYTMRDGVVEKSNALALMAAEGLIEPEEGSGTSPSGEPS